MGAPTLTFGIPPSSAEAEGGDPFGTAALGALAEQVRRLVPVGLRAVELPSYADLFASVVDGSCDVAWCPPFIALDLLERDVARPIVALERVGGVAYHAALLAAAGRPAGLQPALAGARAGWVAPESAAGYIVPRLHLTSLGIDPETIFGAERFYGSYAAASAALARGEADVIATYAARDPASRRLVVPDLACPARVVLASGPIPGDVIVARATVPPVVVQAFARGLIALPWREAAPFRERMQVRRFVPVSRSHLDALARLRSRAFTGELAAADLARDAEGATQA